MKNLFNNFCLHRYLFFVLVSLFLFSTAQAEMLCRTFYSTKNQRSQFKSAFSLGSYKARAIWRPVSTEISRPTVIMVPGSGSQGPRELVPGSVTLDGKDAPLFDQLADVFNESSVNTLQLGKPGVEDQVKFNFETLFYDRELYQNLRWSDLLTNLDDAVKFVLQQPGVDPKKIFILGHSEGTQLAIDYASLHPNISGVILLGFAGEDLRTIIDWQLFKRPIESFVSASVDTNRDGYVSLDEALFWPEFKWDWQAGVEKVSLAEIEAELGNSPENVSAFKNYQSFPLWADGVWDRGPIYAKAAALTQDVHIFSGELDEQTKPQQAIKALRQFQAVGKENVSVTIVPGVGHGFSPPRPPRGHSFLDMTVGPMTDSFLNMIKALAEKM